MKVKFLFVIGLVFLSGIALMAEGKSDNTMSSGVSTITMIEGLS